MKEIDEHELIEQVTHRLDELIGAFDGRISSQLDAILHHPTFQQLERAWRGLAFVVDRTDFAENIQIALLNCSMHDLRTDLERPGGVERSGFYQLVYTAQFGDAAGQPYGAIIADFVIGPEPSDVHLLEACAEVAHAALAPFVAGASPLLLGVERWSQLLLTTEGAERLTVIAPFAAFRGTEVSRAVGLTLPRFLLRPLHKATLGRAGGLAYRESVDDDESCCWGNASFAFATRLTDSFASYRYCPRIIGAEDGRITGLAVRPFWGVVDIATDVPLSREREAELAEAGFIPLVACGDHPGSCHFWSASSVQARRYVREPWGLPSLAPARFAGSPEEAEAEARNQRANTMLPGFFILARMMHYLKMIFRSHAREWEQPSDVAEGLNAELDEFVAGAFVRTNRKFLLKLKVIVERGSDLGSFAFIVQIRSVFKHEANFVTLQFRGKLER